MLVKVISSCSIKAFRYRVHALEQDLWKETDPIGRANLALQLADAATTLARLERQEAQRQPEGTGTEDLPEDLSGSLSDGLYGSQKSDAEGQENSL